MGTTCPRFELWQTIMDAVAAGCRIPLSLCISDEGDYVNVTVLDEVDVTIWALHFGISATAVSVYRSSHNDTGWQRSVSAERDNPWLTISHLAPVPNGPAASDEFPIRTCMSCGQPMTAHTPHVTAIPGEPVRVSRPYRCAACNRWQHLDITDPNDCDRLVAMANVASPDLYTPVQAPAHPPSHDTEVRP